MRNWSQVNATEHLWCKSTLVQVMVAPSHYLSQCWWRLMSPCDVTKPQRVYQWKYSSLFICSRLDTWTVLCHIKNYVYFFHMLIVHTRILTKLYSVCHSNPNTWTNTQVAEKNWGINMVSTSCLHSIGLCLTIACPDTWSSQWGFVWFV